MLCAVSTRLLQRRLWRKLRLRGRKRNCEAAKTVLQKEREIGRCTSFCDVHRPASQRRDCMRSAPTTSLTNASRTQPSAQKVRPPLYSPPVASALRAGSESRRIRHRARERPGILLFKWCNFQPQMF
eukprot:1718754-Pleurochrysis_carterae.AAC.1